MAQCQARTERTGLLIALAESPRATTIALADRIGLSRNTVQVRLDKLNDIPEVLGVIGLSGVADLLIHVAVRDADDLYRTAGDILGIKGVKRTTTALVMREMADYRITPLVETLID